MENPRKPKMPKATEPKLHRRAAQTRHHPKEPSERHPDPTEAAATTEPRIEFFVATLYDLRKTIARNLLKATCIPRVCDTILSWLTT